MSQTEPGKNGNEATGTIGERGTSEKDGANGKTAYSYVCKINCFTKNK